jgi:ABC-type dipeptide/oligopeptide/nickel transport system ATPase subunit
LTTMIDVEDLTVVFDRAEQAVTAVDGVSFSVEEGEIFGLVGESGCGKSTILRTISGLQKDWYGRITITGVKQEKRNRNKSFYELLQMVFQDPYGSLHPRHTVDTALMEPAIVHKLNDRVDRVISVLEDVGLGPEFRFRYPHQLSGGQRQRVAIARSLISEPKILLLDEPTSALDVSVQAEILNLLCQLHEKQGLTYILVSHDLAVISHMCDRVAVMLKGKLVEELTVESLTCDGAREPYTRQLIEANAI